MRNKKEKKRTGRGKQGEVVEHKKASQAINHGL